MEIQIRDNVHNAIVDVKDVLMLDLQNVQHAQMDGFIKALQMVALVTLIALLEPYQIQPYEYVNNVIQIIYVSHAQDL